MTHSLTYLLTDNLKARDASASKNIVLGGDVSVHPPKKFSLKRDIYGWDGGWVV